LTIAEETEKRLQLLYQITSQSSKDLDEQLDNALKLTNDLLDMEIGIISLVNGEDYTVRNYYPSESGLQKGQVFELGSTYCSITLGHEDVLAINHMRESEYERHPCYKAFSLESYIGIPIRIRGEVFGTINFSSSKPKEGGFLTSDYTLLRLLGDWVAAIVNRARIVNELKEKNERLELISTNSVDLICLHSLEGNYRFISPSVKKVLGYSYKELLGRNHADFIHKEDLEWLRKEPYEALKREGQVTNIRYRILTKKGDFIWFESSVKTIFESDGKPIGMQSTSREVTDRKRLETMFEQAQEMAKVGGWEFDLETGELFWTEEVYRIHDKEPGASVKVEEGVSFFPGEAKNKIESAIAQTIETGEKYDLVLPFISAKGIKKWVRAIGKAHFEDGKATRLSGTFQDISRQMSYEERITEQNEELLRLTETKDKLYSIIAHDLKGAFFGINGMLDLLKEEISSGTSDENTLKKLALVSASSKNSYDLLENMLEWITVQNSDIQINKEEINVSELIEKSISVMNSAALSKGVTINNKVADLEIMGSKEMLSTVFRNLISNAIKYSQQGDEVLINSNEHDYFIQISIKDEGIGMPEKVKNSLFDKIDRPQRRGTKHEKGTGLGLLLCHDLVEAHNGEITVKSEEGKGSEFIINLPKK